VIPTLFFFFFLAASTHLFLPLSLSSTVAEVVVDTPLSFWRLLLRFVWIERFFSSSAFTLCLFSCVLSGPLLQPSSIALLQEFIADTTE
jgi:hypothetical protein